MRISEWSSDVCLADLPARSFFASASCVVAAGATPVFADVDLVSQNIDPDSVRAMLTPRTKAVICVHLAGWPCNMDALTEICGQHRLFLIEDCAQAHGAVRSEEHTSELQSLMRISYAVFCLKKKKKKINTLTNNTSHTHI